MAKDNWHAPRMSDEPLWKRYLPNLHSPTSIELIAFDIRSRRREAWLLSDRRHGDPEGDHAIVRGVVPGTSERAARSTEHRRRAPPRPGDVPRRKCRDRLSQR